MNKRLQIALISGGFALAGVALSQVLAFFQKNTSSNQSRNLLLRQKHDELGQHFIASVLRVTDLMHAERLEDIHALSRNVSAEKLHLLCELYFPAIASHSARFLDASTDVYLSLVDSYNPLDERPSGIQADDSAAYKEARSEFIQARDGLIKAIQAEPAGYGRTRSA